MSTTAPVALDRNIQQTVLPNGLRVISESMPHVRSAAVGIWIGTGARFETGPENGISHFIEHMLFKGTKNRTAEEIAREVDATGGHLDAYTAKELVSYNSKVLDETLPRVFDVLADMVLHPNFHEEDIEKEKGVILEELKLEVDNPEYLVHENFSKNFWKDDPIGRSILGTRDTIKSFQQEMLRDYWRRVYSPANMIVTAAGHVKHECVVEMVGDQFADLAPQPALQPFPPPTAHPAFILKDKKSLEQMHLVVGVPCFSMQHPLRYAAYVMSTVLGGGMSSRLFQNIREKHGLAYAVFSELSLHRDCGVLAVYAGVSPETARKALDLVLAEFRQLKDELIPAEELRRAKDHLKGSTALSLEGSGSRMANLARQALYHNRFLSIDDMMNNIERVTAEEIQQVAEECFRSERLALSVLGRTEGVDIQREHLVC